MTSCKTIKPCRLHALLGIAFCSIASGAPGALVDFNNNIPISTGENCNNFTIPATAVTAAIP